MLLEVVQLRQSVTHVGVLAPALGLLACLAADPADRVGVVVGEVAAVDGAHHGVEAVLLDLGQGGVIVSRGNCQQGF